MTAGVGERPLVGRAKRAALEQFAAPRLLTDAALEAEVEALVRADEESRRRWACDRPMCDGLPHRGWLHNHARWTQRIPTGVWSTWLLQAGRGWGKTRTAAEAVKEWAKKPGQNIAVVAKKVTLAREICFESPKSGLLSIIPPEDIAEYHSDIGNLRLTLTNGTVIRGFGAEVPDNLRGWAFDKIWADEYASWNRHVAQETLDMLWFCLREADEPQVIISTTPKALPHIVKLVEEHKAELKEAKALRDDGTDPADIPEPTIRITRGATTDNAANLSAVALKALASSYAGTRLGDQELAGVLLEDVEGALWQRWMFEVDGFRLPLRDVAPLDRIVVAVDPATTTTETADESGICVAGRGHWRDETYADQRPRGYVLHSEAKKLTPIQTMKRVAQLYHKWRADCVVLEANNGGEYLATVLQMVDPTVPYRIVNATRDKRARATPVASLYEQQRIHHVGPAKGFDELERVMTTYVGAPDLQEKSPDILDAAVWALTDLFLDPAQTGSGSGAVADARLAGRR